MKLLSKTNRYYLLYVGPVFLVGGLVFYFILQSVIRNEISQILDFEIKKKIELLKQGDIPLENPSEVEFEIKRVVAYREGRTFRDTVLWDGYKGEWIPYRQITVYENFKGQPFRLTFRESLIESEKLMLVIAISLAVLFTLMVLALLLFNFFQVQKLWAGFYENIRILRAFRVESAQPIPVVHSDIDEFREMNRAIRKMTDKIQEDYLSLKEFTENASHEIQTPLAVIKSHLDLLMEDTHEEEAVKTLAKISLGVRRISKINQTLLLLSKIDNQQFKDLQKVDLKTEINLAWNDFKELAAAKELSTEIEAASYRRVQLINPSLAGILINNLLGNAIRHNIKGGWIRIRLDDDSLEVSNTGRPLKGRPERLFDRFAKENPGSESSGLGLALVKKVIETYHWRVTYTYNNNIHTLRISF